MRFPKSILFVVLATAFVGCGVNPVTGKRELQWMSEAEEIKMGQESYAPMRQAEGGDMTVMPELTAYINEVGQKLAVHAHRQLPYEFNVLNNSVPNAWALPGGKISVNRGLLTELNNEAELAAVLGHEIVHADARHSAKAQERGTLMQAGMAVAAVGAAVGGVDSDTALVALGAGAVGMQMTQMKFGRDQELESDLYGTEYMKAAGYDPNGAVTLQETFVRLSKGQKAGMFEQWFASHPPSEERVAKNKETAARLGVGGELGADRFQTRMAELKKAKPAYDKYDQAVAAVGKKDYAKAKGLAAEATAMFPKEGTFHELQGYIEIAQKNYKDAVPYYEKAIQYNPNYYGSYLGGGIAQAKLGNKAKAKEWLTRSEQLLPTEPAQQYLKELGP